MRNNWSGYILLSLFFLTALISKVSAQTAPTYQSNPIHQVKRGDTLWDLAAYYLQDPFLWPLIWEANKSEIVDPHWIYPEQKFVIPLTKVLKSKILEEHREETFKMERREEVVPGPSIEEVRIPPPSVPRDLAFYGGYLSETKLTGSHIIGTPEERKELTTYHLVYIDQGRKEGVEVGDFFTIFRVGGKVKHPRTHQYLGRMVEILGRLEVREVEEKVSTAQIVQSFETIRVGDLIKPYEEIVLPSGLSPLPTTQPLEGFIVEKKEKERIALPYEIVYIDQGMSKGVVPGDVFEIYHPGKKTRIKGEGGKTPLPDMVVGELQVLAVQNQTATAYLTSSTGINIKVGDPIRLTKKMTRLK